MGASCLLADKAREFAGAILLRKNLPFLVLVETLPVGALPVTGPTNTVFAGVLVRLDGDMPPDGTLGGALPTPGTDAPSRFTVSKPPELHCPLTTTAPGGHEIALPDGVTG